MSVTKMRNYFSLIKRTNTNDGTDNILVEVTEHPNKEGWENLQTWWENL